MAYIGNTVTTQGFTPAVDFFSGNASTTAFTLSRPVASVAQVQAVIENVPQIPGTAYTVSGNTITFTSAPPSGTNNIYVYYTSPITQLIAPSQGTVGAVPLDVVSLTGTGAMQLPIGSVAQRPASTTTGLLRYNSGYGYVETYNGSAWVAVGDQTSNYYVDYLVVAGGAGGGYCPSGTYRGGGGGAGGLRSSVSPTGGGGSAEAQLFLTSGTAYTVTIGAGGAGGTSSSGNASNGSNSVFSTITSTGGGGGGNATGNGGASGGSGGGGAGGTSGGAAGTSGQGYAGGGGNPAGYASGGGGGAGGVGVNNGVGPSVSNAISGTATSYAEGGTGSGSGTNGTANTGNGAQGQSSAGNGGTGGSGIVIVRYLGTQRGTGGTVTSSGGYTIHTFTSSGTYTA